MFMDATPKSEKFALEWFDFAKQVVDRIALDPEILAMKEDFLKDRRLSLEQRSQFIAIANRIKYEVMYENYGDEGTDTFMRFTERWREWYDTKGVVSNSQAGRRLTNEEHIVYSSTPDAEEFFMNLLHKEK